MPEDKLAAVRELQDVWLRRASGSTRHQRRPALAAADIGIAMGLEPTS